MRKDLLQKREERIGTQILQKNGYVAVCTDYLGKNDVQVTFFQGTNDEVVRDHVRWAHFTEGKIGLQSHSDKQADQRVERLYAWKPQTDEHMAVCIVYDTAANILIRFLDDGEEVWTNWTHFWVKHNVKRPSESCSKKIDRIRQKQQREGKIVTQRDGTQVLCKKYYKEGNIDIQYEDGCIRHSCTYTRLKDGEYTIRTRPRVGTVKVQAGGLMTAICIAYRNCQDADFQLSTGRIVKHQEWGLFMHGGFGCAPRGHSTPELIIAYMLSSCGFANKPTCKEPLKGKELDLYNPVLKIAIEYDGYHFHCDPDTQRKDWNKDQLCKEAGIRLIRLREKGLTRTSALSLAIPSYCAPKINSWTKQVSEKLFEMLRGLGCNVTDMKIGSSYNTADMITWVNNVYWSKYRGEKVTLPSGDEATIVAAAGCRCNVQIGNKIIPNVLHSDFVKGHIVAA